nr:immunoglobulin light chain junction region [Macaca mulatta]MOX47675.1 immunoglobulin light chain junction region [Macaca mulatta]MOX47761.1 immunoglobulin light chain junction region [Macaca mulatta]MOX47823.1 immunoglobulin light chain junction region [Macaca mulatta]MOX47922.1 immunoglobulin light chain junction region [Macaca mulatta]
CQQGSSNPVTF